MPEREEELANMTRGVRCLDRAMLGAFGHSLTKSSKTRKKHARRQESGLPQALLMSVSVRKEKAGITAQPRFASSSRQQDSLI